MKKIMVFGTFDRLHPGHEFVLRQALKRGTVTVIVARASNVERIKGKRPLESDEIRLLALREKFPLLTVTLGDTKDFLTPVKAVNPDLILLGYDQRLPPGITEGDLGCDIERLPSFHPERFKSSLLPREGMQKGVA